MSQMTQISAEIICIALARSSSHKGSKGSKEEHNRELTRTISTLAGITFVLVQCAGIEIVQKSVGFKVPGIFTP